MLMVDIEATTRSKEMGYACNLSLRLESQYHGSVRLRRKVCSAEAVQSIRSLRNFRREAVNGDFPPLQIPPSPLNLVALLSSGRRQGRGGSVCWRESSVGIPILSNGDPFRPLLVELFVYKRSARPQRISLSRVKESFPSRGSSAIAVIVGK